MAVLGYLPKLKRSLEQVFVAHFLHDFSNKISLFNTLSNDEVSMAYLFVLKISNKMCYEVKIYLQSYSKAVANKEKKWGRRKYENLKMSRTKTFYIK